MDVEAEPTWKNSLLVGSDLTRIGLSDSSKDETSALSGKMRMTVMPKRLWREENGKIPPTELTFGLRITAAGTGDTNLVYARKEKENEASSLWPVCHKARTALATLMLPTLERIHQLSTAAEANRHERDLTGTDPTVEHQEYDALVKTVLPLFKVYLETDPQLLSSYAEEDNSTRSERCELIWMDEVTGSVQVISDPRTEVARGDNQEEDTPSMSLPASPGRRARLRTLLRSSTFPFSGRTLSTRGKSSNDTLPSNAMAERKERRRRLTADVWTKARQSAGDPSLDLLQVQMRLRPVLDAERHTAYTAL